MSGVVIVGAGQAAAQAALSLRDGGYQAPVTLVGEESEQPYQRPPLSKAYMLGKADEAALRVRQPDLYAAQDIRVVTGERVEAIDRASRRVSLACGGELAYDHLILATGARNRALPARGADLDGVFMLRTLEDARRLRARLTTARRAVVVGAGFIGLEFAAVAAKSGCAVEVIEAAERVMARAVSPFMSGFFAQAHRDMGVVFHFAEGVLAITGADGKGAEVHTTSCRRVAADLVVVGIGVIPNVELAEAAGLATGNGICTDADLLTSDPSISAIGDCASSPSPFADGPVRIESVQNATDQARAVARRLCGRPAPYGAVPWFWSDQGAHKLQIAGLGRPDDETLVLGDPSTGRFSVCRFHRGRLACVESVNRAADHMAMRKLLQSGGTPSMEVVATPGFDLKAFVAALPTAA